MFEKNLVTSILVTFFIFVTPLASQASWSTEAIHFANENFGTFPGPHSLSREAQADLATVYGGGMREVRFQEDLTDDQILMKMPALFKNEIKVFLRKKAGRAPLLVFIPGVFANGDDGIARAMVSWFSQMGYHVLTLPNCWSKDFAKAAPLFKDDYPDGEATAVLEMTKRLIATEIGAKNVSSVQIMAESLGALTAAVVYSKDSRSRKPIFTGGATLTWPPIKLHAAIAKLDAMMTETDAIYKSECHNSIRRLATKWRILVGKYLSSPTADDVMCAPAVVAQYSFRRELIKLAKTMNDVEKLHRTVPDDLLFSTFIKNFAPRYVAALSPTDSYGQIEYWLRDTEDEAAKKIRILTSEDDFLNQHSSWRFPGLLDRADSRLLMAHWGGHIGLTNTKAYEGLIRTQFGLH